MTRSTTPVISLLALLCIGFGLLSLGAVLTKSATCDEPLHLVSGYACLYDHDFRVDPEDPPLFKYWAMIPHRSGSLTIDKTLPVWKDSLGYMWREWILVTPVLYWTPGLDAERYLNISRAMMSLIGIALAGLIAWWAWELGGKVAAVVAVAFFCLDPNFLGHASLVKNDVSISLIMCGLCFAAYLAGQRLTRLRMAALALLAAAAMTTKFSGVMLIGVTSILLIVRALMGRPWLVFSRLLVDRLNKLGAAVATIILCLAVSYVAIWACYGFRYSATPDPNLHLNFPKILQAGVKSQLLTARNEVEPSDEEVKAGMKNPPLFAQTILWANDEKVLPEGWLAGLLDTWATTQRRPAYLMGEYSWSGWWYYFPLAMLFKTPVATLAAVAVVSWLAIRRRIVRLPPLFDRWGTLCIAVPVAIYMITAMLSHLNLGLRHVLPVYPFIYIWLGTVLASLWKPRSIRAAVSLFVILIGGLAIESLAACPDFIAFFNVIAGGSRGGYALLGDSNLDWGQDLTLLRKWQKENPNTKLIVSIFGGADWQYYVKAETLTPDELHPQKAPPTPATDGRDTVLAIGASDLQGIYTFGELHDAYAEVAKHRPFAVLGGTIYLYYLPFRD